MFYPDRMSFGQRLAFVFFGLVSACATHADEAFGARLVAAAQTQIGVTTQYDPAYSRLKYPGGDVPLDRGVCTDVLIRAYRALGVDLQRLVHEDIGAAWSKYPKRWGSSGPDANIDHRRVPNLQTFFRRHGTELPISAAVSDYAIGDLVTWRLPSGVPHIGIVAAPGPSGRPMIVHNIGAGVRIEDMLFEFTITGHFRYR